MMTMAMKLMINDDNGEDINDDDNANGADINDDDDD